MIKRFDIVRIKTVENVTWLSGPSSRPASPQGNWSVVAGTEDDTILISKDETVARIPIQDVVKVADYGIEHALDSIKKIRNPADVAKHPMGALRLENNDGKGKKGKE